MADVVSIHRSEKDRTFDKKKESVAFPSSMATKLGSNYYLQVKPALFNVIKLLPFLLFLMWSCSPGMLAIREGRQTIPLPHFVLSYIYLAPVTPSEAGLNTGLTLRLLS